MKAGIDANSEVIPGEDPEELRALAAEYYERFTPDRPEHYAVVDSLIASDWLLRRLRRIEAQLWNQQIAQARKWDSDFKEATSLACALSRVEDSLTRLQRRIDSADRAYHRALNQIRRLQHTPLEPFQHEPLPEAPADPLDPLAQPDSNQEHSQAIGFVPSFSVAPAGPPPLAHARWGVPWRNMQNPARKGERQ
jgi:hypothetical protein